MMEFKLGCYNHTAVVLLNDPWVIFCNMITNYMKEKIEKAQYHRVVSMGTKDQRFEVSCKDRTGQDRVSADKGSFMIAW